MYRRMNHHHQLIPFHTGLIVGWHFAHVALPKSRPFRYERINLQPGYGWLPRHQTYACIGGWWIC